MASATSDLLDPGVAQMIVERFVRGLEATAPIRTSHGIGP
jgi:hypothetical protein